MSSFDLGQARLLIALDIRHPLAYLALEPALELAREVDTDLLPLAGQMLLPPSPPAPGDDRAVRHKRNRAHMIAREIAVYAAAQGLTVREPYRNGSPRAAHLGWLWMRERHRSALPAYLREAFRRYWAIELDAANLDAIVQLLRELGLDGEAFANWAGGEGSAAADAVAEALRAAEVYQVPAYLIDGELFYGRQHLPLIRWILAGRTGSPPI